LKRKEEKKKDEEFKQMMRRRERELRRLDPNYRSLKDKVCN
jgi:hypothetical protein